MSNVDPSVSPSDSISEWLDTHTVNGEHVQLYVDEQNTPACSTGTFKPYAGQTLMYYVFDHDAEEEEVEILVDSGIEINSTYTGSTISASGVDFYDGMDDGLGRRYLPVRESD
ncbi:hypothetical protein GGH12_003342 [Coemansia sp. RSA 1822]|nr:hypothetical protein LPJ76_003106 [Coemansia sp. RSA 638]KAJ2122888.1 hypothetical protein IW147_003054 [Coemansia sp. RSA 720]KAJ2545273.1 hypothetical protein GGF49_000507 [Coemansia sp. RSA 1853]KAJ2562288.1 hypothetical protein GGH12_003342 [Coemansia sp. RSA 1822]